MNHVVQILIAFYLRFVSYLFGAGMVGCSAVLILTFWEDVKTIAGRKG